MANSALKYFILTFIIAGIVCGCSKNHPLIEKIHTIDHGAPLKAIPDFEPSQSEQQEVEEFIANLQKNGEFSYSKIVEKAFLGNSVALHLAGEFNLLGIGIPIDRSRANMFFEMAGSLGDSISLYRIMAKTVDEDENPFLFMVYLNLVIAHGHREYKDLYDEKIAFISKMAGKSVVRQIEKLAQDKYDLILDNQSMIQEVTADDKLDVLISHNICSYDFVYDDNYWKPLFKSEDAWKRWIG